MKYIIVTYILLSCIADYTAVGLLSKQQFTILILVQLLVLYFAFWWKRRIEGKIKSNVKIDNILEDKIHKAMVKDAIIASRIIFLIINLPVLTIFFSWRKDFSILCVELIIAILLFYYEWQKGTKCFSTIRADIHSCLKLYSGTCIIAILFHIIDNIFDNYLGVGYVNIGVVGGIITSILFLFSAMILLVDNTFIIKSIYRNYQRDPFASKYYRDYYIEKDKKCRRGN